MTTKLLPRELRTAIQGCGYFPEFVEATVQQAVASEEVVASLVHHEATFNRDEIRRHVTVLVLTPTRLLVGHTDDGDAQDAHQAVSTVESVPLRKITSVALSQIASHPERYVAGRGGVDEAWLSVSWGVIRRVEIDPTICSDPNCEADHGMTAQDVADDLTLRVSSAGDGAATVQGLINFSTALQLAAN